MAKETKRPFNKRAFVSVLGGFSFVLMSLTGVGLFFAPSCRIARDTSWVLWGHSKEQFEALHVWFSAVFVIAAAYHIYLNWTAIKNYFKTKVGQTIGLRTEWVTALLICLAVYIGTVRSVWPFSPLIDWQDTYKHGVSGGEGGHGRRGGGGGGPSTGRGPGFREADPCDFEGREPTGRDPYRNVQRRDAIGGGYSRQGAGRDRQPGTARRGMGRMTLGELCRSEGIKLDWAVKRLREEGFDAQASMTIREIADQAGVHPSELREVLELPTDH